LQNALFCGVEVQPDSMGRAVQDLLYAGTNVCSLADNDSQDGLDK